MLLNGYMSNVSYLKSASVTIFTKLIGQGLLGKQWVAHTLDVVISWFINSLFIKESRAEENRAEQRGAVEWRGAVERRDTSMH